MATLTPEDAFTAFVREYGPALARTAWLLTGDRALAQDLVQDALARTLLAWDRIAPEAALSYTRRAIATANIDRWRRRRRESPVGLAFERATVDAFEDRVADRDRVARMLALLPPAQRRVVVLRYWADLSEQQVADELGMSVPAVRSAAHRGLTTLRGAAASAPTHRPEGNAR